MLAGEMDQKSPPVAGPAIGATGIGTGSGSSGSSSNLEPLSVVFIGDRSAGKISAVSRCQWYMKGACEAERLTWSMAVAAGGSLLDRHMHLYHWCEGSNLARPRVGPAGSPFVEGVRPTHPTLH